MQRRNGQSPALSFGQERIWFTEQLTPDTAGYIVHSTVRLHGPLDADLLRAALDTCATRHDSLRMCFTENAHGEPQVAVIPQVTVPFTVVTADDEAHARTLVDAAVRTPFDLTTAPLLRVLLVRLGEADQVLHVGMHHIVSDGWSLNLLLAEVAALYGALTDGRPVPPPPSVDYTDYAAWQRDRSDGPAAERELAYWRGALAGVPPLELPTDRPRPAVASYAGDVHRFAFDAELTAGLRRLGRAQRATLYMTLLAGWQALLFRYSGQRDFAVGSPVAGRVVPELEKLVGLFVNTVAIRADLSAKPHDGGDRKDGGSENDDREKGDRENDGEPSFSDLLRRTRNSVVRALSHQEVPFERLVKELNVTRDVSRAPVFQTLFTLQNYSRAATTWPQGLTSTGFGSDAAAARFDLSLYVSETSDGLRGMLVYNTDLFDPDTARQLGAHYETLLRAALARPDLPVVDLPLLDDGQERRLREFATGPTPPADAPRPATAGAVTLADLIDRHVAGSPQAPAVVCGEDRIDYRELDRRANQLAHFLRARGVGPDRLVGICLDQSVELAVALLGVLRAGGAYLPLDPEQPPARLALMLADADPAVVLTSSEIRAELSSGTNQTDPTDRAGQTDPTGGVASQIDRATCLDLINDTLAAQPTHRPESGAGGDHLAYVIYTSGSTGTPKGVAVAHRQVLNYLDGVAERFSIVPASRYALLQSLSFDFSVTVFYLALATGGTVHLVPRRCTGEELADELRTRAIDYLKMTPSHLTALAAEVDPARLLPRRALILGGEAADLGWAAGLARHGVAVFNHYGPTEATVGVTTYPVSADDRGPGAVPIGRPLPYARVHVLDTRMRPVPVGVPGEIYLGGDRLARGYLHQPELTEERFVSDPFGQPGDRLYRTGDRGRWRADGQLVFLGRTDHQVKIRGFRVELGEVEAALRDLPAVHQAAVVLRDDRLVAYLEPTSQEATPDRATPDRATPDRTAPDRTELRRLLADRLPDHMIPSRFCWLDRLPLQDHGKVDRRALPDPVDEQPTGERVEPAGPVETLIAEIWRTVLGVAGVGATDDFFDLGGHSLLATQVVARLRRELPTVTGVGTADARPAVSVMDLFRHRTVRELAGLLTGDGTDRGLLLHELTPPAPDTTRVATLVCVPYGGGSAVVYQPLADALPAGHRLLSVAMPGHDIGLADEPAPIEEVAQGVVAEILDRVDGPLILYGHCGPGGALAVEVARRLEAAGRDLDAVYLGAVFPFGRPSGGIFGPLLRLRLVERIRSDRIYRTWLQAQGTSIGSLDPDEVAFLIKAMRHDARVSEDYFTALLRDQVTKLRAPVISVVGERDRGTDFYEERFQEWHFLSDRTALAVIDEAGHYFLKYRAEELADIVTGVHHRPATPTNAVDPPTPTNAVDPAWRLQAVSDRRPAAADTATSDGSARPAVAPPAGPQPSLRRFGLVAAGQIITTTGTAMTNFAVPLWIYLETGSLARFALFSIVSLLPGLVLAPLAGAVIDRTSRRRILLLSSVGAGGAKAVMAGLLIADQAQIWHFYLLVGWLSVVLAFQRLSFVSAVPQLVPKRFLGHANGLTQTAVGLTQFMVPLLAVALLEAVGLRGIMIIDVVAYVFAIAVLIAIRFPRTLALQRRESLGQEILGGLRYSLRRREFRGMLAFFAALNLFLFPVLFLLSPLVLGFADLAQVAQIALTGGVGAALGGLVMLVWGGPRRYRMRAVLIGTLGIAVACVLTGLRPSLLVIGAGAFGMYCSLGLVNGIYNTIIQIKVPARFHGRVFALNQMVAWSTMPLGWGVIAPLATSLMEPLLMPDGALASSVGVVIGVGPGRGIALLYVVFGLGIALTAIVSLRTRVLSRFDDEVPDAPPDDLIGIEARQARIAAGAR
ncbi:amino acid adenylation domain-containing protein [Solwaraspora sp. WMMD406]|uniref:non-ribosomal peptide synthetase/MFS transporter n=1 Tax=Solwaraspora sp. WMMD406 TaxID=3016095 RepID=UPI002417973D|nr:non-ribosomal peptide synthetase/MFS transporter [Solwaraspora sp. WMMD406]MDG4764530.1 amino acid adenylation domain-containing protein [Solwaraspora sp. WMMD406]